MKSDLDGGFLCGQNPTSMNMQDYDSWNEQKKGLHKQRPLFHVRERDVVLVRMGVNVGVENNGKGYYFLRPAVVIRRICRNKILVVPLSRTDVQRPYQVHILWKYTQSVAIIDQGKIIDVSRCFRVLGRVSMQVVKSLRDRLIQLIDQGT